MERQLLFNRKTAFIKSLSFILILALIFSMSTFVPADVNAAPSIGTKDDLNKGPNLTGTQVYFGSSDSSIKWIVVDEDPISSNVTLFSTSAEIGARNYDSSSHKNWSGSDICNWLNSTNNGFLSERFTSKESDAIEVYGTTEQSVNQGSNSPSPEIEINQKIVLPSIDELFGANGTSPGAWDIDANTRAYISSVIPQGSVWWLRSPGSLNNYAFAMVTSGWTNGRVDQNNYHIFPALKLDLSNIFMISAASGAGIKKSDMTPGANLTTFSKPTNEVKLTLLDESVKLTGITPFDVGGTGEVQFNYNNSNLPQDGNWIMSAIVRENSSGKITHYGKLKESASTNTKSAVRIPAGFDADKQSIEIFVEQINGDTETDYAGKPVKMDIQSEFISSTPYAVGCTNKYNNDGKIIVGEAGKYQYRESGKEGNWATIGDTSVSDLPAGDYDVWYNPGSSNYMLINGTVYMSTSYSTITVPIDPLSHTVKLDVNGGDKLSPASIPVKEGEKYGVLPTPTKKGYTFNGWYTAKTGGTRILPESTFDITSDQTLYAQWTVNKYKISFKANAKKVKKLKPKSKIVTFDSKVGKLPKPKRTGYKFKGWYTTKKKGGTKLTANTVMKYNKNIHLYARWTPNGKVANCKWVHLRKAAGESRIIKRNIKKGTKVAILGKKKVAGKYIWYKVNVGGKTGYIYSKYIKRV